MCSSDLLIPLAVFASGAIGHAGWRWLRVAGAAMGAMAEQGRPWWQIFSPSEARSDRGGVGRVVVGALLGGLLSVIVSLVGIVLSRGGRDPQGRAKALGGLAAGLGLLIIVLGAAATAGDAPQINDITTDLDDPPAQLPESRCGSDNFTGSPQGQLLLQSAVVRAQFLIDPWFRDR